MLHTLPIPNKRLIGHRGVAGLRPENTICSFRHAADLGLNWIEFDVQLTKDNIWVVIHDNTVDRTTNAHGLVSDFYAEQICSLEAGLWFEPPYPQQKVPTLFETLQLASKLGLYCNIEVKADGNDADQYSAYFIKFAQAHLDLLVNKCLISSFDISCAKQLATALPLPVALLTEEWQPNLIEVVKENNFASLNCDVTSFNSAALHSLQAAHIPVYLYTVNDPATAQLWLKQGVQGLFTDRPDLLAFS